MQSAGLAGPGPWPAGGHLTNYLELYSVHTKYIPRESSPERAMTGGRCGATPLLARDLESMQRHPSIGSHDNARRHCGEVSFGIFQYCIPIGRQPTMLGEADSPNLLLMYLTLCLKSTGFVVPSHNHRESFFLLKVEPPIKSALGTLLPLVSVSPTRLKNVWDECPTSLSLGGACIRHH